MPFRVSRRKKPSNLPTLSEEKLLRLIELKAVARRMQAKKKIEKMFERHDDDVFEWRIREVTKWKRGSQYLFGMTGTLEDVMNKAISISWEHERGCSFRAYNVSTRITLTVSTYVVYATEPDPTPEKPRARRRIYVFDPRTGKEHPVVDKIVAKWGYFS